MIKRFDKEKVIKLLTKEKSNKINAFNVVPNLSDKVLDYSEKVFNFTDIVTDNLEENRKYNSKLEAVLFVMAGMQSSIRQMTNNVNQTDLLCFKGKIKNKLFSLNLNGKSNIDYNLNIIISINI